MTDLNLIGMNSHPVVINDKGQVVGYSHAAGDVVAHAFLYSNGKMNDLTQLVWDLFLVHFYANDINRRGEIIGNGANRHAYILTVPKKEHGFFATHIRDHRDREKKDRWDHGRWEGKNQRHQGSRKERDQ